MFQVILGCNLSTGHVDTKLGMFGVLDEGQFPSLIRPSPILARDNTQCPNRRTNMCSAVCTHSIYGFLGTKLSFRNPGAKI